MGTSGAAAATTIAANARLVRCAVAAVTDEDLDAEAELVQESTGALGELRLTLDRHDVRAHLGQHGRLVAAACTHVENLRARSVMSG